MLRHFAVVLVALCALVTGAAAETPYERGSYLVNAVMACDGCHTPRGPDGFNMEKRFSGGYLATRVAGLADRPSLLLRLRVTTADRAVADRLASGAIFL